jgi:hypothetical protein
VTSRVTATTARGKERTSEDTRDGNIGAREVVARSARIGALAALMTFIAVAALALTVASLAVIGGALFALFLFFPIFVLALVAVLAALEDHTVQQHHPSMDGTRWRNGS